MPIVINVPGGKMDNAGRGVAAAQQYRAGEQQMRQRDEGFQFEKDLAIRRVEMDEQMLDFEQEQLAQSQESEAAILMGDAIAGGAQIGNPEAYQALLAKTSPRFRLQMKESLGRAEIERVKRAEIDEIMGELPLTPETEAAVHEGRITDPGAIKRSMAKERQKIWAAADQEESRVAVREHWLKIQAEPGFVMPDRDMDADAYSSVQEIMAELYDGSATKPGIDYRALGHELEILTNPNKLKAARNALQRAVGNVDIRGNPKLLGNALDSAQFRSQVEGEYVDQRGDEAQAARRADVEGGKTTYGREVPPGAAKPAAVAKKPPAEKPRTVADVDATTVAGPKPDESRDALIRTVLADMGYRTMPGKGTQERAKVLAEIKRRESEQGAAKMKIDRAKYERTPSGPM